MAVAEAKLNGRGEAFARGGREEESTVKTSAAR
jgi:hypothetical protein